MAQLNVEFQPIRQTIFYHTPCHLRIMPNATVTVKVLELIPGITIKTNSQVCCGMGGAYGFEKANYKLSKNIASRLYNEISENPTDRIIDDCGGCKLQIEDGTKRKVEHPILFLKEAYGI
jgi:glycerol-3-phosphate dehydrogenase subunit C